ncbi:AP-3 complex subunit delta [Wickerhamiella sorbophila]|uniref:AP-3 complex subunit delta n=1 Tax=Wickerhamiella sorbophila TaxID=45607 RepID=A0A2T0FK48_9ASCO|nr:AP-3 complex subunit delta [Wickerhamiella sorbophila]PRT55349.1 AP-3 complex subunit delta [Wickerhamiella sorbophila]
MESRLRPFGILFGRSLNNLIKGIRARKDADELEEYIKGVIAECREEARSPDLDLKAMAVLKLAYLEMYGYDMSWAGFHVLEVMSSQKFQQKRVGYLAAMQSFRADPELLMLTTNLLKTDLTAPSQERAGIALSGLATIVSPLLAAEVSEDITSMLNHSNSYVRKKAVLAIYKVLQQYPQALPAVLPRLRDRLEDSDTSVVSAVVNALCELSHQSDDPSPFLEFAPQLFFLLKETQSNWLHIKILKLLALFTQYEPRLVSKVLPHIVDLIHSTDATSLRYEAISAILRGRMVASDDFELVKLILNHLRDFLQTTDPNLKFVALTALSQLVKVNAGFLAAEHEIVLEYIDTEDATLRRKVLDMLPAIVNEDNLVDIVTQLLEQLRATDSPACPEHKQLLVSKIVALCSTDNYSLLPNFEWYTETLVDIAKHAFNYVPEAGVIVGNQLQNVAVRVKSVRESVVFACLDLSYNAPLVAKQPEILEYTLWVIGEYISDYLDSTRQAIGPDLLRNLLSLPPCLATVPAVTKVFSRYISVLPLWIDETRLQVSECISEIISVFSKFATSASFEIQERAVQLLELFKLAADAVAEHPADSDAAPALLTIAFPSLFNGFEITPVAPSAQRRIAIPPELDLDTPISVVESEFTESESEPESELGSATEPEPEPEARDARMDVYYIKSASHESKEASVTSELSDSKPVHSKERRKIEKVKVEIAQDETIEGEDDEPVAKPAKKSLFHSEHISVGDTRPGNVVVKHKKVKKKKKKPASS